MRCILDTNALIWYIKNDSRLPNNIREDIEYMQNEYYISFLSLLEIDNLNKIRRLDYKIPMLETIEKLKYSNIGIYFGDLHSIEVLDTIEMKKINGKDHGDYIDRLIIATAIAKKHTLISSDEKFIDYVKDGLQLLQI